MSTPAAPDPAIVAIKQAMQQGNVPQAMALLQPLVARRPVHAEAQMVMSMIMLMTKGPAAAEPFARAAHEAEPGKYDYAVQVYTCASLQGRAAEAVAGLEPLAYANPSDPRAWVLLLTSLLALDRAADAVRHGRAGVAANPASAEIANNLATALLRIGEGEESLRILRRVVATQPRLGRAWIALASGMNYSPEVTADEILAAHQHASLAILAQAGPTAKPSPRVRPARPEPARMLRVGVLSPDVREHSVGQFVRPLIDGSLARHGLEVTVLDSGIVRDARNEAMRATAAAGGVMWRDLGNAAKPDQTDAAIRAENLDVVIELSGLTTGQRLAGLARRPAPVQMTYLGYPATTGCPWMDFRIVDVMTDPLPGAGDGPTCVETLLRMDEPFVCYTPPETRPDAAARSAARAEGVITFGCFGSLMKYSQTLLALWAEVLRAVPRSRLLLKSGGFEDQGVCTRMTERLVGLGIDASRIELVGRISGASSHLAMYQRVDIALDTYPYHGTTTTCEALAMGVPTVTLAGRTHAARVGVSLLSAGPIGDVQRGLIASDEAGFVRAAVELANDSRRLADLHGSLRARMEASALCDAAGFAGRFAAAVRQGWTAACAW
jgi:predicted O-linked N-acetylglucosamine transferase (SPINDLY family)